MGFLKAFTSQPFLLKKAELLATIVGTIAIAARLVNEVGEVVEPEPFRYSGVFTFALFVFVYARAGYLIAFLTRGDKP